MKKCGKRSLAGEPISKYRRYYRPIVHLPSFCSDESRRSNSIGTLTTRNRRRNMEILMVLTSHDVLGNTGRKTGFWLEEFAAPYFVFRDAGVQLTLASPKGGQPPLDPKSDLPENQTPAMTRFKQDQTAQKALSQTVKLADVKSEDYDTVFYVGGHGPMWDLAESPVSMRLGATFEKRADWQPLSIVDGRLITGQNPASSIVAAQNLV